MLSCRITPLALALLLLLSAAGLASSPKEPKRVLILYGEEKGHPAHSLTDQGIRAAFRSNKLSEVQLYTEYLDVSRFSGPGHAALMADYLRRKYSGIKIDTVIAVYPSSVEFLLANERAPFHGVPIIACAISRSYAESLEHAPARRRITGHIIGENAVGVLDEALRLRPGTKHAALVAGTAPIDAYTAQLFRETLKRYTGKLDLIDLTRLPLQETLARVGSLPPDTMVLYASIAKDGAGENFVGREVLSLIARAAHAPVFGLYDTYMGFGIVGGPLISFEEAGETAAGLALRVMAGESPGNIPFTSQDTYAYVYDWRELKRWGISDKALPPSSIVKFKPPSIWEEYWWVILSGICFMVIETFLIAGLVINLHKRKRADELVRKSQDDYRDLAGKLLTAQETERRRLARELHDDLSQRLAALAIETGFLERDSISKAAAARVQEIREGLVDLSGNVHDISRRLHPSILEDLGLGDAIRSECDGLARREQIEARFESRDCPSRIPLDISLCLYRVTQESLRNIVKHARATKIDVSLTGEKETIHLLIKDNGRGFNPLHVPREPRLGLISMRERVRLIQGELIIRSQPGQGTIIEIKAPLREVTEGPDVGSEESL